MIQASIHGRIGRDPSSIAAKTGTTMGTAPVAVTLDDQTLWVRVVAFGKVAHLLLKHTKGETVAASGRVQMSKWTDQSTGQTRENLEIVADTIVSARSVRPGGGRKRSGS